MSLPAADSTAPPLQLALRVLRIVLAADKRNVDTQQLTAEELASPVETDLADAFVCSTYKEACTLLADDTLRGPWRDWARSERAAHTVFAKAALVHHDPHKDPAVTASLRDKADAVDAALRQSEHLGHTTQQASHLVQLAKDGAPVSWGEVWIDAAS